MPIGRNAVLARPFAALLEDLVETVGKLLCACVVDGELPVTHAHLCSTGCITAQVEERDVAGSGTVHAAVASRTLHPQIGIGILALHEQDSRLKRLGVKQFASKLRIVRG